MGRTGFEPATFRLSVERSSRAELPARSAATQFNVMLVNKNFRKSFNAHKLFFSADRARSLARIKASAFGAGNRGFKSHRARQ